jgi:hypothetical protein
MNKRKFIIECEIPERWINDFCTMLKTMEFYGNAGHSEVVGIFSDGDGDFRPRFNIATDFEKTTHLKKYEDATIYDAG